MDATEILRKYKSGLEKGYSTERLKEIFMANGINLDLYLNSEEEFQKDSPESEIIELIKPKEKKPDPQFVDIWDPKYTGQGGKEKLLSDIKSTEFDDITGKQLFGIARNVLQGATFAYGDEIEAQLRSVVRNQMGVKTSYDLELDKVRKEMEEFAKENPISSIAGEVAGGFLVPGFLTAKLIKYLPKVGKIQEGQMLMNALRRSLYGASGGSVAGGLYASGMSTGEVGSEEFWEDTAEGAKWGGLTGAVAGPTLGLAGEKITELYQDIKKPLKDHVDVGLKGKADKDVKREMLVAIQAQDSGIDDLLKQLDEYELEMPNNTTWVKDPLLRETITVGDLMDTGSVGESMVYLTQQFPSMGSKNISENFINRGKEFPRMTEKLIGKHIGKQVKIDPERFYKNLERMGEIKSKKFYNIADPVEFNSLDLINAVNRHWHKGSKTEEVDSSKMIKKAWIDTIKRIPKIRKKKNIPGHNFGSKPGSYLQGTKTYEKDQILMWDTFRKQLKKRRDKLPDSPKGFDRMDADDLNDLIKTISTKLESVSGDYKKAKDLWSTGPKFKKAFEKGMKAEKNKKITSTEMIKQLQGMSDGEKNMFRLGFAHNLYAKIQTPNFKLKPTPEKLLGLLSDRQNEKIRVLFKTEELANEVLKKIDIISRMDAKSKSYWGNSATARRQFAKETMEKKPHLVGKAIETFQDLRGGLGNRSATRFLTSSSDINRNTARNQLWNRPGVESSRQTLKNLQDLQRFDLEKVGVRPQFPAFMGGLLAPGTARMGWSED